MVISYEFNRLSSVGRRKAKPKGTRGGARPGAGRKPTLDRAARVTLFLEGDVIDALQRLADEQDVLFSGYVRRVLSRHVAAKLRR